MRAVSGTAGADTTSPLWQPQPAISIREGTRRGGSPNGSLISSSRGTMREPGIFADESGSDGPSDRHHLLTAVVRDRSEGIADSIRSYEGALRAKGLPDIPFHASPLMNGKDMYSGLDLGTRKALPGSFRVFFRHTPVRYHTFAYATKQFASLERLAGAMRRRPSPVGPPPQRRKTRPRAPRRRCTSGCSGRRSCRRRGRGSRGRGKAGNRTGPTLTQSGPARSPTAPPARLSARRSGNRRAGRPPSPRWQGRRRPGRRTRRAGRPARRRRALSPGRALASQGALSLCAVPGAAGLLGGAQLISRQPAAGRLGPRFFG